MRDRHRRGPHWLFLRCPPDGAGCQPEGTAQAVGTLRKARCVAQRRTRENRRSVVRAVDGALQIGERGVPAAESRKRVSRDPGRRGVFGVVAQGNGPCRDRFLVLREFREREGSGRTLVSAATGGQGAIEKFQSFDRSSLLDSEAPAQAEQSRIAGRQGQPRLDVGHGAVGIAGAAPGPGTKQPYVRRERVERDRSIGLRKGPLVVAECAERSPPGSFSP